MLNEYNFSKADKIDTTTAKQIYIGDPTTGTSTTTTSQWQTYTQPQAERGWECPRCGRINAPWVRQCDCSRDNLTVTWTSPSIGTDEWWKTYVTCNGTSGSTHLDSDTFKVHPETTTWKAPSSVCGSDSATSAKSNPNSTSYTTAYNQVVGGSDYWDNMSQTWSNMPNVSNSSTSVDSPWNKYFTFTSDKIKELQAQINNLKENK